MPALSSRVRNITPSGKDGWEVHFEAMTRRQAGEPIIMLSVGDHDFHTPAETLALTLGAKLPARNLSMGWRANRANAITTGSAATSAPSWHAHDLFLTWTPDAGALAGLETARVDLRLNNLLDKDYHEHLADGVSGWELSAPGRGAVLAVSGSF